jgi:hypothetical protein
LMGHRRRRTVAGEVCLGAEGLENERLGLQLGQRIPLIREGGIQLGPLRKTGFRRDDRRLFAIIGHRGPGHVRRSRAGGGRVSRHRSGWVSGSRWRRLVDRIQVDVVRPARDYVGPLQRAGVREVVCGGHGPSPARSGAGRGGCGRGGCLLVAYAIVGCGQDRKQPGADDTVLVIRLSHGRKVRLVRLARRPALWTAARCG